MDLEFSLSKANTPPHNFTLKNLDGWGIGWYKNNSPKISKEGTSAINNSSEFSYYSRKVSSKIIVVHVRKVSDKNKAHQLK